MNNRLINTLIVLVFISSFSNCASFSKIPIEKHSKSQLVSDFEKINGKYLFYSISDTLKKDNIYENLLGVWWRSEDSQLELNNEDDEYYAEIKLINENELDFRLFKNEVLVKNETIKGKLKDGMFYLNQNFSISGLPYVFGTFTNDKKRIILKDNSIIIDRIKHEFGAVILIFEAGFKYDSLSEYIKIE
ncbi:hypothetical protein [uncultured Winogradskyella sp.]|uniref:hypothetical protein n=1 Tax=uncultured Winogradskyella sp. TaxID=395353 RepID=UPI002628D6B4|nr:hypothetical protein [uncultured Winogradskyella sp.]